MTLPIQHIAVLVPARNEEALLPRCLRSIQVSRRHLPAGITSDVIVVSDQSHDRTVSLAAAMLERSGLCLSIEAGCVGVSRAMAARTALARFGGPADRCWLANTDADCELPLNWLTDQIRIAARGVEGVAGIVEVDDFREHAPYVPERFRLTYAIHADGTHPHVHGANLGVRADAYIRAGGWAPLAHAEDHDLWRRLRETGAALIADASLVVITSGRRVGRAPSGFAGALAAHNADESFAGFGASCAE